MMDFYRDHKVALLTLALSVMFVYLFGIHGPLFWDDVDWVVNNPLVHSFSWENIYKIFTTNILEGVNGVSNYYRPLLLVTLLGNYLVSGTDPALYHLVNILIHLGNGLLIYYLVFRWFTSKRIAFISALIYSIQPLQTEAVSYIVGRADPLSVFFILLGLATYVHRRPWLTGVCAILAILSRETGMLFPAYLAVTLIAFELSGTLWQRIKTAFIKILPYLALSLGYIALRLTVFNFQNSLNFYTQTNIYTENILYRIYTFLDALVVYVRLMFWPTDLRFDRFLPVSTSLVSGMAWLGALFVLAGLLLLVWLQFKKRTNEFQVWFFGLGIFFSGLSLSSGILVPVNSTIYEHWLYFPLFGFAVILAYYLDQLYGFLAAHSKRWVMPLTLLLAGYFCFLGVLTIDRNITWASPEKTFKNIISYQPDEYRAINNLGSWYYGQRELEKAKKQWALSIKYDPNNEIAYANLGNLYADEGKVEIGEQLLLKALDLQPGYFNAYRSLFVLYIRENRLDEARQVLATMESLFPSFDRTSYEKELMKAENPESAP